jgi:hypothetical protein
MSDGPSTRNRRITKPCFHTCSTYGSRSQASLCLYTQHAIANRIEDAFGLLRYSLGGDRPSQTAQQALSRVRIHGLTVRVPEAQEWYFTVDSTTAEAVASLPPTYATHAQLETNTSLQ